MNSRRLTRPSSSAIEQGYQFSRSGEAIVASQPARDTEGRFLVLVGGLWQAPLNGCSVEAVMLAALRIESLAVVDSLELLFEPGLNVVKGETGAGKSLLVDAVSLLL